MREFLLFQPNITALIASKFRPPRTPRLVPGRMTTDGSASGGLPRNLTLESGNHDQPRPRGLERRMTLMRRLFVGERDEFIRKDAVEKKFAQWASQDPAWARDLERLRAAYRELKGRRADGLASKSRAPFSCNSLLCHWTFKPPDALLTGNYCTEKAQTQIRDGDSFSDWSCRVASAILQDSFDGLHLVYVTQLLRHTVIRICYSN